jgi:HrpA-like RNA helicase
VSSVPEIQRTNLANVVLLLKSLNPVISCCYIVTCLQVSSVPEIHRTNLANVVLLLKSLNVDNLSFLILNVVTLLHDCR